MSSGRIQLQNMLMRPNRSKLKGYKKMPPPKRWNIVAGDTVQVIDRKHPEYGKQGVVNIVLREKLRAIVEGVNICPRHIKPDPENGIKGQRIMTERSIHYSNLNLVDPVTGFPTRISWSYLEDGKKVRISKRSGAIIPKPELWRQKFKDAVDSEESDTIDDKAVWATSYEERPSKWEDMRAELLKIIEENDNKSLGADDAN
jgi:large subunit ribosomal protein L24